MLPKDLDIVSTNHLRRSSTLSKMSYYFAIVLFFMLTHQESSAHDERSLSSPKHTSKLQDPLVWDTNSLYKSTLLSQSMKLPTISQRRKRSATMISQSPQPQQQQLVVDACQSKMEILTPYYATNSKGKLRTIINSELIQQAIQVETCIRSPTSNQAKCNAQSDCGCEQKYKWHRLLVLDPKNSGAGKELFMDWFSFPSSCVCRCKSSSTFNSKQFLRALK